MDFLIIFLGLIVIFFPSALADDRYADINLLALILGANIAFAPSIYVLKITLTNVKSQF